MHSWDTKIQGHSLVSNIGKKTSKAVVSVKLNGHQTVDKLEVKGPTPNRVKSNNHSATTLKKI
ncbi:MAG: hypothetical protein EXS07_16000 [Gemmataceae bacterium]|nr:hypothetical protein [Gemmataceae bacterium]